MIYADIKNFNKQFEYEPKIENEKLLKKVRGRVAGFVVAGMGGSHLAADILKSLRPELDVTIWANYGLPPMSRAELRRRMIIASSYSGNTEEAIDAFLEAKRRGLPVAVVAAGGKLVALAKKHKTPYIEMPARGERHRTNWHLQPRMALGLSLRAMLRLMGENGLLRETDELAGVLRPGRFEAAGKKLARKLKGKIPVVYSSLRNAGLAYVWKVKFNETAKVPMFCNFLPELNHNEMAGFDVKPKTRSLAGKFHFIFLEDQEDDPRIRKRMKILGELYRGKKLPFEVRDLRGGNRLQKIFSSLLLADWTAYYAAKIYGTDPERTPMVEDFKKMMSRREKSGS